MFEVATIRENIPRGKFRVAYVDLFSHEDGVVEDCNTREKAFDLADRHNAKRSGSMDDVYYVYDDNGNYLRGPEHVGTVGVSP